MASAALISYPHFEDLGNANAAFVETTPNLKKFRRRSDKKEQLTDNHTKEYCNTECNVTSDRDRYNTLRIKKKDIQILPTLDENEEKVEESWMKVDNTQENKIQEISDSPTIYEAMIMNTNDTVSSPNDNAKMKLKITSNHSLLINNTFEKPLSSENNMYDTEKPVAEHRELTSFPDKSKQSVEVAISGNKLNNATCLTNHKPDNYGSGHDLSKNTTNSANNKSKILNVERDTIVNTSELQGINLNASVRKKTDDYGSGHDLTKKATSSANNKSKTLNWERNLDALMPNTTELQGINSNANVRKSLQPIAFTCNAKVEPISMPTYSKCHVKEYMYEPNSSKCYMPAWKLVLVVLWTFTFMGALIYIIITNIDKKPIVIEQPLKYERTNYELFLLIAKNFRRLIVSSFYAFR